MIAGKGNHLTLVYPRADDELTFTSIIQITRALSSFKKLWGIPILFLWQVPTRVVWEFLALSTKKRSYDILRSSSLCTNEHRNWYNQIQCEIFDLPQSFSSPEHTASICSVCLED
ncbi:hypothetical protein PoB_002154200 [Plakobranchus ocellatus]|uniref:Uncharacterized protein n=1 Tax=Plakobranchus ocellatus TaxID=259542 RepID=A0AAV3ZKD4_9GAST|nr:hypothetical protein PoB_002154200 [Plakobranchus ocellatus]